MCLSQDLCVLQPWCGCKRVCDFGSVCPYIGVLCVAVNCEHVHVPARRSCMCLCVHVRSRVSAGNARPHTHTRPAPGGGSSGGGRCGRQTLLPPAPPPPQPLPAGRFPDRPNRQKLRARGPLGAFLLWCELPMAGAGAGAGTQAQPNQPGRRARSPGRQAETRGRPPQAPPAPARPRPRALRPMAGPGAGRRRGGAWLASRRLRPQDLGDQLSRPARNAPRKGRACPGEASR